MILVNRFKSFGDLSGLYKFTDIILNMNVPYNYSLFGYNKWLRYPATIYGYSYDRILVIIIYG